ncbi:MAG: hypothetical protein ACE5KY_02470, partial [Candidatus Tectimicrobiota bacterium]
MRSQPPPGVKAEPGNYLGASLTVEADGPHLFGLARARAGLDLAATSPDWGELSALAGAEASISDPLHVALAASAFVLGYTGPSDYRAWAASAQPSVRLTLGRLRLIAEAVGWLGRTFVRETAPLGPFQGGPGELLTTDLELAEASLDAWLSAGPATLGIGGDLSWTETAQYAGGRVWLTARPSDRSELVASLFFREVREPGGVTEGGFLAIASYDVDPGVTLEGMLARPLTELLLGSPQALAAGLTVRFRVGPTPGRPNSSASFGEEPLAEALDGAAALTGTRRVRFTVRADADSVALVGDFTGWEPRAMRRGARGAWVLEIELATGVYRFAFLTDGRWYVPEGAPGAVDDG